MGFLDFKGPAYAVKIREQGSRRWYFLGSDGYLQTRRIHAALMPKARAERAAKRIPGEHPGYDAKAVPFTTGAR